MYGLEMLKGEDMKDIFKKYGIIIDNEELLLNALTHSSYSNEHESICYERLEYLGDATLEIVCSDYLYNNTNESEGEMSRLRRLYVCENALYEYSKELDYVKYIRVGNGMGEANKTIIADVFEALIAVVYLEHGLDCVKKIFNELIVPYIERRDDFLMDYKIVEESGPAHHKVFKSQVIIDGLVYGEGVGFTKKEAEQNAAKDAYIKRAN